MKVLWISPKLPYPPESGDKLRQYNLMRKLSSSVDINLIAFTLNIDEPTRSPEMLEVCRKVRTFFFRELNNIERIASILTSTRPYYVSRYQDAVVTSYLQDQIRNFRPDVIQIEHTYLAEYFRRLPSKLKMPSILTKHNIDADLALQSYKLADTPVKRAFWWLEWKKMSFYEPRVDNLFSTVVVMSEVDKAQILDRKKPPSSVCVVENGVDTERLKPLPAVRKPVLLFVGALDYLPNQDAAIYICNEILPVIRNSFPDTRVLIVGRKPSQEILNLACGSVEVWGDVPSVEPFYERASLAIVPLRAGSGSRLKILEAMALGKPVISTSKGAEGLQIEPGKDFMVAEDTAGFAESVSKLLSNPELYDEISANARKTVEEKYDWSEAARKMTLIYERLGRSVFHK